jgi:hypothetical protein
MIRIIIGAGTSAAVFRQAIGQTIDQEVFTNPRTALVKLVQTIQIGRTEPWHGRGTHKMGQPPSIVGGHMMPGSERHYQEATGKPPKKIDQLFVDEFLQGFQISSTYAQQLDLLQKLNGKRDQAIVFEERFVKQIARSLSDPTEYIDVTLSNGSVLTGSQVIIATGPGLEREYDARLFSGDPEPWQVVSGPAFMERQTAPVPESLPHYDPWKVAVAGGSATAAWSVETALVRGYTVAAWFQRTKDHETKDERFKAAFPPGDRNYMVQSVLERVGRLGNLRKIYVIPGNPLISRRPKLGLEFDDGHWVYVDQLVYAIGSDFSTGIGAMLSKELQDQVIPYRDLNRVVSTDGSAVLALGTEDRSLFIVGAAVYNATAALRLIDKTVKPSFRFVKELDEKGVEREVKKEAGQANYAQIAETLPQSAVPPEGIGLIMASIEAFTEYMPVSEPRQAVRYKIPEFLTEEGETDIPIPNPRAGEVVTSYTFDRDFNWDINFNTANRNQIAAWMAATRDDLDACAANLAVALIVAIRAKRTFGLQWERIQMIMEVSKKISREHGQYFRSVDPFLPDRIAAAVAPRFAEYIGKTG